ncbi:MAG: single-stranded DNA-binding protein [Bacteroides sp.]|nr:single-stranded DNA-binding protein [Bacteroides sp.]
MSVNKVILIGNVGQDPKVTYYDGGNCVAMLSLATTDKGYTLQNGTQIPDRTEWHNLIFRNRLGEVVDKYVHKGDKLFVEGKIRTRSYDDQAGVKRYVTEIFVDNMEMLTPKGGAPTTPSAVQPTSQPIGVQQPVQSQTTVQDNSTDDLPF